MRVIILGQAPFGRECLQALTNQGENIVGAITVPDDPNGKKTNPFKDLALELGIPLLQAGRLKEPEVYQWVREKKPDLLVLAFVTQFVPKDMIEMATYGGINYHPSLLPKYRGGSAIAWALINGEKETGVTIHCIDEGVDTGDIVLQESVPVDPEDNTVTLYYNKLFPLGVKLVAEATRLFRTGKAPRIPQDPRLASFQPVIKPQDTIIDWRQPAANIYNLIRGSFPAPGAGTKLRGEDLVILEAKMWSGTNDVLEVLPGQVAGIQKEGVLIGTGKGALLIKKIQSKKTGKASADEFAGAMELKPGEKLG